MGLFKKQGGQTFAGSLLGVGFEETKWNNDAAAVKAGKKPYSTISMKLTIDKDGVEEPISQFLEAGFFYPDRGQTISDDGTTLGGGAGIGEGTEAARFIQSAVDAGIEEASLLDEDGNGTNFSALVDGRYEFGRAINREKQMAAGRKALGIKDSNGFTGKLGKEHTEAEVMEAGKQVVKDGPKKGEKYNRTFMIIESILGETPAAAPAPAAAAPKTAAPKAAKGGKSAPAPVAEPDYEDADALLVNALAAAKNKSLKLTSLSSVVVKWAVENDKSNDERDAVRNLFADPAYLGRNAGWKLSEDGKSVSL